MKTTTRTIEMHLLENKLKNFFSVTDVDVEKCDWRMLRRICLIITLALGNTLWWNVFLIKYWRFNVSFFTELVPHHICFRKIFLKCMPWLFISSLRLYNWCEKKESYPQNHPKVKAQILCVYRWIVLNVYQVYDVCDRFLICTYWN